MKIKSIKLVYIHGSVSPDLIDIWRVDEVLESVEFNPGDYLNKKEAEGDSFAEQDGQGYSPDYHWGAK